MHLTPEQIERQPFKMGRRGYDIQQVRDFLREIAAEMRARQEVRERLAETGEESAVAEDRAHSIIAEARATADQIVADAQAKAGSADALVTADARAVEIVGSAEGVAAQIIEDAEEAARPRSGEVLAATQARLDQLLQEERAVHARVEALRLTLDGPEAESRMQTDARDRDGSTVELEDTDSALADLLKSTLREETLREETLLD